MGGADAGKARSATEATAQGEQGLGIGSSGDRPPLEAGARTETTVGLLRKPTTSSANAQSSSRCIPPSA